MEWQGRSKNASQNSDINLHITYIIIIKNAKNVGLHTKNYTYLVYSQCYFALSPALTYK